MTWEIGLGIAVLAVTVATALAALQGRFIKLTMKSEFADFLQQLDDRFATNAELNHVKEHVVRVEKYAHDSTHSIRDDIQRIVEAKMIAARAANGGIK